MNDAIAQVHEFMKLAGQPDNLDLKSDRPHPHYGPIGHGLLALAKSMKIEDTQSALRARLLVEEVGEYLIALSEQDEAGVLDAITDLIYVAIGAGITFDLPLLQAWREVHRANMSKFPVCQDCDGGGCGVCGSAGRIAILDSHGKVMKPEGWEPPDIERILTEYRSR